MRQGRREDDGSGLFVTYTDCFNSKARLNTAGRSWALETFAHWGFNGLFLLFVVCFFVASLRLEIPRLQADAPLLCYYMVRLTNLMYFSQLTSNPDLLAFDNDDDVTVRRC
jgi:hypothetical protein